MSKYVSENMGDFLNNSRKEPKKVNESFHRTAEIKRKYGERPTVSVGTQAPLRNRVLSYIAENVRVSKNQLRQYIIGLSEGNAKPAAISMFLKRNVQFFIIESKNGETFFKFRL